MLTDEVLLSVRKPARYTGGEINSVVKDHKDVKCKIVLSFPDIYEVGMSHLGLKILYSLLNERDDVACERVFAPWHDMEKIMRERKIPLFSLETKTPINEFDIIGFSLQYELSYTNVLNMLDLAGIPAYARERGGSYPLIIGGGPCVFNPEPMADFFDCFVIGDAEDAVLEIADVFIESRKKGEKKDELLKRLAGLEGVYVPSLPAEQAGIPKKVRKRSVLDLDAAYFPKKITVPYIEIVHDRIQLEIMRGCRRNCNFCQASAIYRPNRQRSAEKILSLAKTLYENTGYDEISLISLSSGDHPRIMEIASKLNEFFKDKAVSISLPSLRVEDWVSRLPLELTSGRRTGLTFAPEVGSEKMRKVINKNISPDSLKECAYEAFKNGWRQIKLYFMIGLPQEDYTDLDAIVELARQISEVKIKLDGRPAQVNASVSVFIPKPHTKFERAPMLSMEEVGRRQKYIKDKARKTRVKFSFHDIKMSYLEAVLARGDRDLSAPIYKAWKAGCRFDAWSEYFDFGKWVFAFKESGIDPDRYALRQRAANELLPWDFIELP